VRIQATYKAMQLRLGITFGPAAAFAAQPGPSPTCIVLSLVKRAMGQIVPWIQPQLPSPDLAHAKTILAFLESRNQEGETTLVQSIEWGHLRRGQLLVSLRADVNAADQLGRSPLICAAVNGQLAMVECLLKAGADRSAVDKSGRTASMIARGPQMEAIRQLLAQSA
jgi:ankyrin repeat protein